MTNFLSFARSFSAMLMPFRSLLPPPSFEAPHLNRGSTGCRDTTRRRPVAFAPQDKPGAGSFRTDEHSKMRLIRTFLILLPVAFILAGGAQSLEWGGLVAPQKLIQWRAMARLIPIRGTA